MYDLPSGTLFSFKENPIHTTHKFSTVGVDELVSEIAKFKKTHSIATPETEALLFYLVNHALHTLRSTYDEYDKLGPREAAFAHKCNVISTRISKSLFYHICCVAHGMLWVHSLDDNQMSFFEQNYGKDFAAYLKGKAGGKESITDVGKYKMNMHQFLGGVSSVYSFGKIIAWGKPYSMIVKTIHRCANGSYSMYTAADQIWSLCHNGGTVLNKGIGGIYEVASNFLFDILDVQDAGQIPGYVQENIKSGPAHKYMSAEIKDFYKEFVALFPQEFKPVNYELVKSSAKKREAAMKAMNTQYQQWWQNPNAAVGQIGINAPPVKKEPEQKIDGLLIGTFKKNKWI